MNGSETGAIRGILERAFVWVAGFVLTGRVFHGLRRRDVRNTDPETALLELASFLLVCTVAWWALFVIPREVLAIVVGVPVGLVAMRAVVLVFQLSIIELIDASQYFYGVHDTTFQGYVRSKLRKVVVR